MSGLQCESLLKLVFEGFFVHLFDLMLYGESIIISFLYLCKVEEE